MGWLASTFALQFPANPALMVLPLEEETMRIAIGYIRVSSEEQADSGLGLEAQRQRIRAYCEMKGLSLATIFEDAGVSGGKALATRPAGAQLMAKAKKNKPVLAVARIDLRPRPRKAQLPTSPHTVSFERQNAHGSPPSPC
jgi:hypothetical protein